MKIIDKYVDETGKVWYYIDSKDYYNTINKIRPEFSNIKCSICDKPYNEFQRVIDGISAGEPCYFRENWHETTDVKKRKILDFYCSAECTKEDYENFKRCSPKNKKNK